MLEPLQSAMVKCIFSLNFIMEEEKSSSGMHAPFSLNEAISVQICVPIGFYLSMYHEVTVQSTNRQNPKVEKLSRTMQNCLSCLRELINGAG